MVYSRKQLGIVLVYCMYIATCMYLTVVSMKKREKFSEKKITKGKKRRKKTERV
jgi:hypothetical protein